MQEARRRDAQAQARLGVEEGQAEGQVKAQPIPRTLRDAVRERDGEACQLCGRPIGSQPYSIHHRRPRQMGGDRSAHTADNLVLLCGTGTTGCHGWIESHRQVGYQEGFLVHRWDDPASVPVHRFRRSWALPGQSWIPVPEPEEGR